MEPYYRFKMLHWRAIEARDTAKHAERKARKRIHSVDAEQRAIEARGLADVLVKYMGKPPVASEEGSIRSPVSLLDGIGDGASIADNVDRLGVWEQLKERRKKVFVAGGGVDPDRRFWLIGAFGVSLRDDIHDLGERDRGFRGRRIDGLQGLSPAAKA